MPNRGFPAPATKSTRRPNRPNGELGFYLVADGTEPRVPGPDSAAVVHPLCRLPAHDRGPSDQRRGGRAGQLEHYRGGVGSMSVLSDAMRQEIRDAAGQVSRQAGGHAAGPAHHPRRVAARSAGGDPRNRRDAGPASGPGARYDVVLRLLPRRETPLGKHRVWICRSLSCMLRGGEKLLAELCRRLGSSPAKRRRTAS